MNKQNVDYSVYLVTDEEMLNGITLKSAVEEAILGGATIIQLREKNLSSRDFYNRALEIREITLKYNVPLIINDRVDIAMAIDADGVHLGQQDLPVSIARKILGNNKIIGVSAQNIDLALKAQNDGADYLGVGAVFKTNTKKDALQGVGLQMIKSISEKIKIPFVGIGGIDHSNAKSVIESGANGVAIVSCILKQKNIRKATEDLRKLVLIK